MNKLSIHKFKITAGVVILIFLLLQFSHLLYYDLFVFAIVLEVLDICLLLIAAALLDTRTSHLRKIQEYAHKLEDTTRLLLEKTSQLEEATRTKSRLLRTLNHDIRSPLGSIILASELMKRQVDVCNNEKCFNLTANIDQSAQRMTQMVTRFLQDKDDASALPDLQIEDVDLQKILDIIVSTHQIYASRKNITLAFIPESHVPTVRSDRISILQIFDNLISNAIKFSPPSSVVTVRLSKSDTETVVQVEDQGPGLTDEDQQVLFLEFAKRSAQPTAGETSFGVGLSVVRQLVNTLGANISFRTELGKGTVFIVAFPMVESPGAYGG